MSQIVFNKALLNVKSSFFKRISRLNLRRIIILFISMISFASLVLFVTYSYIGSPKEMILSKKNQEYLDKIALINNKINQLDGRLAEIESRDDEVYRSICNLNPIPTEQRKVGYGGAERYTELKGYRNSKQIISTSLNLDRLARKLYVQSKSFDKVYNLAKDRAKKIASVPAIQPISVGDLNYISSYYGFRDHPKLHRWIKHTGMDFAAPIGTPIYVTGNGVVEHLDKSMTNYGKVVKVNHGFGYESLYAHMSKVLVVSGDRVVRGQIIGYVGRTGRVTGAHLHYEVLKNGRPVNPRFYFEKNLNKKEYEQMIFVNSL